MSGHLAAPTHLNWNDSLLPDNPIERPPFPRSTAFSWLAAVVASFALVFTAQSNYQRIVIQHLGLRLLFRHVHVHGRRVLEVGNEHDKPT